jgi:toxic protein SymE
MKKKISSPNKYKIFRSRNLKVFRKSFARAYYNEVFFPEIRIAGKWVQDCGFEAGDRVAVIVSRNQIILKKA